MTPTALAWATFGVTQVILLTIGGYALYRARSVGKFAGKAWILVVAGALLVLANLWWFATEGPQGASFIPMRGGVLGAWLSIVTGVEVVLLGAAIGWLSRRS